MTYLAVPLNSYHRKNEFTCGQLVLDVYFQKQANQDFKRRLSTCFVLADTDNRVLGYYTLSNAAIDRNLLPEAISTKLPASYANLPATLLGRLAIDSTAKGKGFGELLLLDALRRSHDVAISGIGSMAVIVEPIDEQAEKFYLKYGFIKLSDSGKLFIPMKTVAVLFNEQ